MNTNVASWFRTLSFIGYRALGSVCVLIAAFAHTSAWSQDQQTPSGFNVAAGKVLQITGLIQGGALYKVGPGALQPMNENNSYSGGTLIEAGTVVIAQPGVLSDGAVTFQAASLATASLQAGADLTMSNSLQLVSAGTLDTNGHAIRVAGQVDGAGSLNIIGNGSLSLVAANSNTGDINLSAGSLVVDNPNAIGGDGATVPVINMANNTTIQMNSPSGVFDNPLNFAGCSVALVAAAPTTLSGSVAGDAGSLSISGGQEVILTGEQQGAFNMSVSGLGTKLSIASPSVSSGTLSLGEGTILEADGLVHMPVVIFG